MDEHELNISLNFSFCGLKNKEGHMALEQQKGDPFKVSLQRFYGGIYILYIVFYKCLYIFKKD